MVWHPRPMLDTSNEPSVRRPVTVVAAVKPEPVSVTEVPPEVGP